VAELGALLQRQKKETLKDAVALEQQLVALEQQLVALEQQLVALECQLFYPIVLFY